MDLSPPPLGERSRLRVLLEHLSVIEDEREAHRVAYPLAELLLLAVCGTIADCDDYDAIADWGADHLEFLRRFLPFHHGAPTGRWLTIMMNRRDQRPLADREQTALDLGRHLRRRSISTAQRSWRKQHGRRPPLRHQYGASRRRRLACPANRPTAKDQQTSSAQDHQRQATPQNRQLEPGIPRRCPKHRRPLTQIRSPGHAPGP